MHSNNGEKNNWGPQPDGTWIPSDKYEKVDINKYRLEKRKRESDKPSDKPNTQLDSSTATSASGSKSK